MPFLRSLRLKEGLPLLSRRHVWPICTSMHMTWHSFESINEARQVRSNSNQADVCKMRQSSSRAFSSAGTSTTKPDLGSYGAKSPVRISALAEALAGRPRGQQQRGALARCPRPAGFHRTAPPTPWPMAVAAVLRECHSRSLPGVAADDMRAKEEALA